MRNECVLNLNSDKLTKSLFDTHYYDKKKISKVAKTSKYFVTGTFRTMNSSIPELIVWVVLAPIALFFCITCIIIIAHYSPYYHGTDVALFSIFIALSFRVATIILIPAVLGLARLSWSLHLCNFYVWMYCTLHVAEVLSFLATSIHWMTIPRYRTGKQIYVSAKYMKIVIFLVWFCAIMVGLVPVIEWSSYFQSDGECRFLPFNLGEGFSVFFIVINIFSFLMALICTIDTMVLFKHMKQVAMDKYQAGRFYLPSSASVVKTASQTVHAKYNEITFSTDLCRLVIILIIAAYLLNHIPLTVIEFIQIVSSPDHVFLENIILWLMLFEALILPHCLWCFSKRYRHGLVYIWKVYIKRDITAVEEDPSACTLQSYTRKVRDVDGKTVRITTKVNGRSSILSDKHIAYRNGDARNGITVVVEDATIERHARTNAVPVTDLDDGMVASNNYSPSTVNETPVKSSRHNSDPVSPSSSYLSTPLRDVDLERSASSSSRKSWKEQMRKKHLPPIFVNEAFENEATSAERDDVNESHYYVSSDYHPDYLVNSLPRSVHSVKANESESEGASNQYNDDDINHILDPEKGSLSSEQCLVMDISDDKSDLAERIELDTRDQAGNIQTAADLSHIFQEDSRTPTPRNKSPSSSASDTISNGSEKSVTLEPYKEERRRPWMDLEEETTSFQSPVKTQSTNQDIDRGFEEALAAGYTSSMAGYSTMGLAFESIKEESEDVSEPNSPRNPRSPFKTQAVSTRSSSPSQVSSDNPFDSAPVNLPTKYNLDRNEIELEHNTPHLTNGYGESVTSFQGKTFGKSQDPPPLTNGYDHFVSDFKSPKGDVVNGDPLLESQISETSMEVANINKMALKKQDRVDDAGLTELNENTAYF